MNSGKRPALKIAVIGPCLSGKSELVADLRARGYNARHVAQEHSYVQDMWQRIAQPDVLVVLDVSYEVACQRKKISWGPERLERQRARLAHARQHCDLYINTDNLTIDEVRARVYALLAGFEP